MLSQLLQREFVMNSLEDLEAGIQAQTAAYANADPDTVSVLDHAGVSINDLQETGFQFQSAIKRDAGRTASEVDDSVFFPRDPIISLVQSALQQFCEEKKASHLLQSEARGFGPSQSIPITDREMDESLASFLSGAPPARKLWGKYELIDIGWANCLAAIGVRSWRSRHPFINRPAKPVVIGNRARVILLSDWASGLPRARKLGEVLKSRSSLASWRSPRLLRLSSIAFAL